VAGAALSVGALTVMAALTVGYATVGAAAVSSQRLAAAADASALAAADGASGAVPGVPCELAVAVARADGATVTGCSLDELVATVTVATTFARMEMTATARAGPPP
jgi:secretion/DNA translocation related TadE-like protein